MSLCAARRAGTPQEFQASSLTTLVQTVAAGIGMTLVPELALCVEGRSELGLNFIAFPEPAPSRTICLAWRKASPRSQEFAMLGQELVVDAPTELRKLECEEC